MKRILVEVELPSFEEYHALKAGPLPKGVSVWVPPQGSSSSEPVSIVYAVIEFSTSVAASVVAAWLVGHFKKRGTTTLKVERREVILKEGEVQKILEEKISLDNK